MNLFRLVVTRPVATFMIFIAAAVFGVVSYLRLPLNLMPDLSYPTLTVRTEVNGYAPQEVESQISRPIEEQLATTEGIVELESRSRAGISDVVLEFAWGTDMDDATQAYPPYERLRRGRSVDQVRFPIEQVVDGIIEAIRENKPHVVLPRSLRPLTAMVEIPRTFMRLAFRKTSPRP